MVIGFPDLSIKVNPAHSGFTFIDRSGNPITMYRTVTRFCHRSVDQNPTTQEGMVSVGKCVLNSNLSCQANSFSRHLYRQVTAQFLGQQGHVAVHTLRWLWGLPTASSSPPLHPAAPIHHLLYCWLEHGGTGHPPQQLSRTSNGFPAKRSKFPLCFFPW